METRELFWGLDASAQRLFYAIAICAVVLFAAGFLRHLAKYLRAAPSTVALDLWAGTRRMLSDLLAHRRLRAGDRYAGSAHATLFAGFAVLFAGTATITLEYDILQPLFGITFWKGTFYHLFGLALDLAGVALVVGVSLMMLRRAAFRLFRLDYRRAYRGEDQLRPAARAWRREDWIFMGALLAIGLSGFLQEGVRLALERPAGAAWEPVGAALGALLRAAGLDDASAAAVRRANWWLHGCAALAFVAAVPWWKAKHMLAAVGALAARDPLALRRLPRPAEGTATGVADIGQFSWKDALDFDACTKCGRCHEACPARSSGYPLSPRDLILDLRLHNDRAQGRSLQGVSLLGGVIAPEALWACRSCGACQEVCPVGVEHPVKIVQMRRQLVERGQMDPLLKSTLVTIADTGNSFGESPRRRAAWTRELEFPVKDIRREAADLLWFVGDFASFDPRNQKVSRTFARLLRAAGQDFALLHEGERTAGNDVRRVGEEGLFEALAEHNLAQMHGAQAFRRIVTTDPHSFNTLRNEYPQFGAVAPVAHYTELLCEWLDSGALRVNRKLGLTVTFHDPCHLGRLNRRFDAPRRVLEHIGCRVVEMPRNRERSFCCGAGGGRIWIPDAPDTVKPSELRVREAAALGALDVFVTCCPKDLTMFEDARKTAGLEQAFVVEDIAELVARAVQLDAIPLAQLPSLADRIAQAVAERVATVVEQRLDAWAGARPVVAPLPVAAPAAAPAPRTPEPPVASAPGAPTATWAPQAYVPAAIADYERPAKQGVRILVPVKHVAKLGDEFAFRADGRGIEAAHLEYQMNEWDDTALEQALQMVEALGAGEVVAVTLGPEGAEETLRKALAKGAHRGVRVWDDAMPATDPVSVARFLAGVALREHADLVVAGAQSADQANGATPSALARLLGWPCATLVVGVDWDGGDRITAVRELEGGLRQRIRLPAPAVLSLQTGANTPRYATMRMIKQARQKPVAEVAADAGDVAVQAAGVVRMEPPPVTRARMIEGGAAQVAAEVLRVVRERTGSAA